MAGDYELVFYVGSNAFRPEQVMLVAEWAESREGGYSETMGEPIIDGPGIMAVLDFVQKAHPEGWMVRDGKVVSAKDAPDFVEMEF